MNIVQLQDQLKNFSQDQLVKEMQTPSGNAPQFLVLGEIMRRQKMQQDFTAQQAKDDGGTVADDAIAAAGVPQGGIADMARAMAPSTDMTQNTGVQAMYAGGPVKKMAKGDKVKTDPAVIAMANRAGMSVDEYLNALGEEEAARIEAAAAQRAERNRMMAMEPTGDSITMPTQEDLDRRFQEEQFAFGASRPLATPAAIDMPTVPSISAQTIGAPPAGLPAIAGAPAMPAMPSAEAQPGGRMVLSPEQLAASQAAQAIAAPVDVGVLPPPDTTEEDALARTARIMAAIQAERAPERPKGGRQQAFEEAQANPADDPFRSPFIDDLLGGLGGRTTEEQERILKDRAAAEAATPEAAAAAAERAKEEGKGGAVPAGDTTGNITPTAQPDTPSGGAGGAGGAGGVGGMSSYEQELISMLQNREKAAQQDKWLALAQVGLNLMSSTNPTLGGALGEAGLKGVEAARDARDQYDKDRLELLGAVEQSRAARAKAAAAGSGGRPLPAGALTMYDAEIEAIDNALTGLAGAVSPEDKLRLTQQRAALATERARLQNTYLSQYGFAPTGASPAAASGVYSMDDVS